MCATMDPWETSTPNPSSLLFLFFNMNPASTRIALQTGLLGGHEARTKQASSS
jgi:hypothetical protein